MSDEEIESIAKKYVEVNYFNGKEWFEFDRNALIAFAKEIFRKSGKSKDMKIKIGDVEMTRVFKTSEEEQEWREHWEDRTESKHLWYVSS
jgi:hypothetical protein